MTGSSKKPVTAIVAGAGHRGLVYASYAREFPERLKIVGVADPNPFRRQHIRDLYGFPKENVYESAGELASRSRFADAVINGTMDHQHVSTSIPLLERGYHLLLEKPICQTTSELALLVKTTRETGRKVMICHVLRFAPFYRKIKEILARGTLGDLVHIGTIEAVSYHHMGVAFVRGKWRRRKTNPILLAKCCHDLDLICWLNSGVRPTVVSSAGGISIFSRENAPAGSGERCLVDCKIEQKCKYSAKKNYVDYDYWDFYALDSIEHIPNPTRDDKLESLRTDNPFGRCVWRCDNDVMDHQSVLIEFENGSIANHQLVCAAPKGDRRLHLLGTEGEIFGFMKEGTFVLRSPQFEKCCSYNDEHFNVNVTNDMHGGGDLLLVHDFVSVLRGEQPSISTTDLFDSVNSHMIAFAADQAMMDKKCVTVEGL